MLDTVLGTVNPTQSNDGETIEAADINTPVNQLAAVINGNIETVNIADSTITTVKIADDAVTAAKIDFGGSGTGVWWEEIGRTTLGSAADTITVSSLPAKKYLKIFVYLIDTGGTINGSLRFNGDSGSNYAGRGSSNGAADATGTSTSSIGLTSTAATRHFVTLDATNVATHEKLFYALTASRGVAGAGNLPDRVETVAKWANTSNQISSISLVNSGTGDYAVGSEIIVLGHD